MYSPQVSSGAQCGGTALSTRETARTPVTLFGCGNPLLDIQLHVDAEFLKKYDLKPDGYCFQGPVQEGIYDEMAAHKEVAYVAGGATLNTLRVCQGLARAAKTGAFSHVIYAGCVGDDAFGKILRDKCESDGVTPYFTVSERNPTGACAVALLNKDRTLCTRLGAANDFPKDGLQASEIVKVIDAAQLAYSAGFFLTVCANGVLNVAKQMASKRNTIYCASLSAVFLVEHFTKEFDALLPYVDILFGNANEFNTFGRVFFPNDETDDVPTILRKTAALPKANAARSRVVVATQGSDPTLMACRWRRQLGVIKETGPVTSPVDFKVLQFPIEPLATEALVDTNSAGDAFVGGFLYGLGLRLSSGVVTAEDILDGHDNSSTLDTAVAYAHLAARHIVQRAGCTYAFEEEA